MEDEVRKRKIENAERLSALKKLISDESDLYKNLIYRHAYFQVLIIDNQPERASNFGLEGILPTCVKIMYRMNSNDEEKRKAYEIYREVLKHCARYSFHCYLLYMEIDREAKARFYEPRMKILKPVVEALQQLGDGKLDLVTISMPPGVGKTTVGVFFLTWYCGRYPNKCNLASAFSDKLTKKIYNDALMFMTDTEYNYSEIFPEIKIVKKSDKEEFFDLNRIKPFPSLTCRSIDGTITGATRAEGVLYCDDLCSGIEEALNKERLDTLWTKYGDLKGRKKTGAAEIHIQTRWSIHDVVGRLEIKYGEDKRSVFIRLPALNEKGESNFDYPSGFDTKFFNDMKDNVDDIYWRCVYMQEPIEREGQLFHEDDFRYYFDLPKTEPDVIVGVCDSKNKGMDYVAAMCLKKYGEDYYVDDIVFSNALPEVTKPKVVYMCVSNNISLLDGEANNGGDYYFEDVNERIQKAGGHTSINTFFTSSNKISKIIAESDFVKKHFIFKHKSTYAKGSEYEKFMQNLFGFTQTGKNKHDDAPDVCAMGSELVKRLEGNKIEFIDRRLYRI